ncbi:MULTISPECIES: lipoyl(octanoyl) transferase LipB [unclassified Siphonobacter]|uniref:lipoyl(octanoyl) transferase LipB n=1 Tax=unclassified Siphonobacter TaxID=2635712 RepID=UPI000CC29C8A|nr:MULTISPECIES: lipoyl(octanoyl) transferase LipB [unclassified Siphonobacter]MDQ1087243.1 lipoyl(octanoyl) transferase [Siphonobacter sp. SORGH_AS_1065]PKK34736.1 lipoyl(octanoyl) transferase [Siphonobacter sp. SORGH_AS_0500]
MNKEVFFQDWGLRDYQSSWDEQERTLAAVVARKVENRKLPEAEQVPTSNYLFFVQHPPVFTLGKSGKPEHLLQTEPELESKGIHYYKINRGGDITFHGPGQLVGYPILDLDNFKPDIHWYMRTLEEAIIRTCADYGLAAGRIDGLTGVWLDYLEQKNPRKICAMGVKASRWVTMHGFALNVNTELAFFDYIVPCGIEDKAVTSLAKEVGHELDFNEVAQRVKTHLAELFEMTIIESKAHA